jgi:hypothetical protein
MKLRHQGGCPEERTGQACFYEQASSFFRDADTQLGTFYPNHYLLVVFPDLAAADRAEKSLQEGSIGYETIAASGEEMVLFAKAHRVAD